MPLVLGAQRLALAGDIACTQSEIVTGVAASMGWATGELDFTRDVAGTERESAVRQIQALPLRRRLAGLDTQQNRTAPTPPLPGEMLALVDLLFIWGVVMCSILIVQLVCWVLFRCYCNRRYYRATRALKRERPSEELIQQEDAWVADDVAGQDEEGAGPAALGKRRWRARMRLLGISVLTTGRRAHAATSRVAPLDEPRVPQPSRIDVEALHPQAWTDEMTTTRAKRTASEVTPTAPPPGDAPPSPPAESDLVVEPLDMHQEDTRPPAMQRELAAAIRLQSWRRGNVARRIAAETLAERQLGHFGSSKVKETSLHDDLLSPPRRTGIVRLAHVRSNESPQRSGDGQPFPNSNNAPRRLSSRNLVNEAGK